MELKHFPSKRENVLILFRCTSQILSTRDTEHLSDVVVKERKESLKKWYNTFERYENQSMLIAMMPFTVFSQIH